jgi:hypothetical protein
VGLIATPSYAQRFESIGSSAARLLLQPITERNSKRDRLPDIPFHRLWRPGDAGELTFVGLRVVDQQNLLIASNGTEHLVLPITAEQRHHLAQHQRGITLTISSVVTIQAHVQGLER